MLCLFATFAPTTQTQKFECTMGHTAIYDSLLRKERPKRRKVGEKLAQKPTELKNRHETQELKGNKGKHGNAVQAKQATEKKK